MDAEAPQPPVLSPAGAPPSPPSPRRALWALVLAVNLLLVPYAVEGIHVDDTDTFFYTAIGRWMLDHGRFAGADVLSFTREGQPYLNYSAGPQLAFALADRAFGLPGLIAIRAVLLLATVNLLLAWLWRRSGRWPLATFTLTLLGCALYMSRALNIRPFLGSHLLLLALLVRLDRQAERKRFDLLIPLVFAAWANVHGISYPIGILLVGIFAAAELRPVLGQQTRDSLRHPDLRRWALTLLACVAALCLNPLGARVLLAPVQLGEEEMMSLIDEHWPVPPLSLFDLTPALSTVSQLWLNLVMLAGAALVPAWLRRRDLQSTVLYALAVYFALDRVRFRPEVALLVVPLLAAEAARHVASPPSWLRRSLLALGALLAAAFLATTLDHYRRGFFRVLDLGRYPVAACRTIAEHGLGGHAFVDPGMAGFVSWCAPSVKVFMDMRSPDPFTGADYWLARTAGSQVPWEAVVARWPVDLIVLRAQSPQVAGLLAAPTPLFRPVSNDGRYAMFLRAPLADERGLGLASPQGIEAWDGSAGQAALLRAEADRQLATFPHNALANETLARLDLAAGRAEDALRRAEALRPRYPRDATWPWIIGLAEAELGRLPESARALAAARELSPAPRIASDLARVLLRAGLGQAAADVMEDEARRRQYLLDADEFVLMGAAREASDRVDEAADVYQRALWLRSGEGQREHVVQLQLRLAALELRRQRPAEALAYAEAALRTSPGPAARLARAHALQAAGRDAEADAAFSEVASDEQAPPEMRAAARAALAR
jgi:tetratricopeptide (TPR) repeat protein